MNTTTTLQSLTKKQLSKAKANYTAIQILMLISFSLSAASVGMLIYSLVTGGGYELFAIMMIILNLPFAILFWKRPKIAYYIGFLYCIPLLPVIIGLIVMVMWSKTKIFFGSNRATIKEVDHLLNA